MSESSLDPDLESEPAGRLEYFSLPETTEFVIRSFDIDRVIGMHSYEIEQIKKDLDEEKVRLGRCLACVAMSNKVDVCEYPDQIAAGRITRIWVLARRLERLTD